MANITISNLRGSDSDSFLDELTYTEIKSVKGGTPWFIIAAVTITVLNAAYDFAEGYAEGNKK